MKKNIENDLFWITPLRKPKEEEIERLFDEFQTSPRAIRVRSRLPNGWTVLPADVPLILALQANGVENVEAVESDGTTPAPKVRLTLTAKARLARLAPEPPPQSQPNMKNVRAALKRYGTDPRELEALRDHIRGSGQAAQTF
jgi:hypothetical protein